MSAEQFGCKPVESTSPIKTCALFITKANEKIGILTAP